MRKVRDILQPSDWGAIFNFRASGSEEVLLLILLIWLGGRGDGASSASLSLGIGASRSCRSRFSNSASLLSSTSCSLFNCSRVFFWRSSLDICWARDRRFSSALSAGNAALALARVFMLAVRLRALPCTLLLIEDVIDACLSTGWLLVSNSFELTGEIRLTWEWYAGGGGVEACHSSANGCISGSITGGCTERAPEEVCSRGLPEPVDLRKIFRFRNPGRRPSSGVQNLPAPI